jgi:uncharacterized membrane protein YeaQ/YmgE (transglycosylase-associated protein family)
MSLQNILVWVVLGGIAGWLASIITGRNNRMGCLSNIIVGVAGGLIGGWLLSYFGGQGVTGFNLPSLLVAFIGSVILLLIFNLFRPRRRRR